MFSRVNSRKTGRGSSISICTTGHSFKCLNFLTKSILKECDRNFILKSCGRGLQHWELSREIDRVPRLNYTNASLSYILKFIDALIELVPFTVIALYIIQFYKYIRCIPKGLVE